MSVIFLLIPIIYVTVSLVGSIINLLAFNFVDDDVIINWPGTSFYGSSKNILIVLSLIGFIAIDVFYIQLIIRYAFQCKLNIYYLEEIIRKIDNLKVIRSSIQNHRNIETYENQDYAFKRAEDFLRHLNQDSTIVRFIVLIGTLQVTNCIINLLNEGNSYLQTVPLAVRLTHWGFLALFHL